MATLGVANPSLQPQPVPDVQPGTMLRHAVTPSAFGHGLGEAIQNSARELATMQIGRAHV